MPTNLAIDPDLRDEAPRIGGHRTEKATVTEALEEYVMRRKQMRVFPDLELETAAYERAAEHFTAARSEGVRGSNTDFLVCAVADRRDLAIFTTDHDLESSVGLFPIRRHRARFED